MAVPSKTPDPAASRNGELIDRVQQLRLDNQLGTGGGRSRGTALPWVLCALMALGWVGVGVRYYKARSADPTPAPEGAKPAAAATANDLVTQLKGTLTPALQINISPDDVSGVVESINFKEGQRVKQGHPLAKLRKDRYQNDRDAAFAALTAAEHRLADLGEKAVRVEERAQAKGELDEAEAARERAEFEVKRLNGKSGGVVVSSQDLERADADLKGATARVARLKAALDLLNLGARKEKIQAATAEVEQARSRYLETERLLKNCEVLAPIDGTVLTKVADRGVLVSPMSFNVAAGICSMADLAKLEVEIDVPERQITRIREGQDCMVQADANPNRIYRGRVDRVMPIADDTKNVVKVRIRVYLPKDEEAGAFLKPKMSVTATVYNRDFVLNTKTDQPWNEDSEKK